MALSLRPFLLIIESIDSNRRRKEKYIEREREEEERNTLNVVTEKLCFYNDHQARNCEHRRESSYFAHCKTLSMTDHLEKVMEVLN